MAFKDLLATRDLAIAKNEACHAAIEPARARFEEVTAAYVTSQAVLTAAHKAIHDIIVERGEYYLTDERGTLTVWKAISSDPGYIMVQPNPGEEPPSVMPRKIVKGEA